MFEFLCVTGHDRDAIQGWKRGLRLLVATVTPAADPGLHRQVSLPPPRCAFPGNSSRSRAGNLRFPPSSMAIAAALQNYAAGSESCARSNHRLQAQNASIRR